LVRSVVATRGAVLVLLLVLPAPVLQVGCTLAGCPRSLRGGRGAAFRKVKDAPSQAAWLAVSVEGLTLLSSPPPRHVILSIPC